MPSDFPNLPRSVSQLLGADNYIASIYIRRCCMSTSTSNQLVCGDVPVSKNASRCMAAATMCARWRARVIRISLEDVSNLSVICQSQDQISKPVHTVQSRPSWPLTEHEEACQAHPGSLSFHRLWLRSLSKNLLVPPLLPIWRSPLTSRGRDPLCSAGRPYLE